jgi:hypothetical protein
MSTGVHTVVVRWVAVTLSLAASAVTHAQPAASETSAWTFSVSVGGYARGNRAAVRGWLAANGYGVAQPKQCGFDVLVRPVCDPEVPYPQVAESQFLGWMIALGHTIAPRASVEVLGASEQAGSIIGRCDDTAVPRDARCTSRFVTVDFSGASIAALGVVQAGRFHFGTGPALLLANWEMEPAHLYGVWLDATYGGERFPLFARAQYRLYQSTSMDPSQHFTRFHPSTLYVGGGILFRIDDTPQR